MNVAEHLPWVRRMASRFHPNDRDDCMQVGLLVVARKLEQFDPSRGIRFRTFAGARVLGSMLDLVRSPSDQGKRIPPARMLDLVQGLQARNTETPTDLPRCIVCGDPFTQSRQGFERMCSVHCRGIWWAANVAPRLRPRAKMRPVRICAQCGSPFVQKRYGKRVAKVCSRKCRAEAGCIAARRSRLQRRAGVA